MHQFWASQGGCLWMVWMTLYFRSFLSWILLFFIFALRFVYYFIVMGEPGKLKRNTMPDILMKHEFLEGLIFWSHNFIQEIICYKEVKHFTHISVFCILPCQRKHISKTLVISSVQGFIYDLLMAAATNKVLNSQREASVYFQVLWISPPGDAFALDLLVAVFKTCNKISHILFGSIQSRSLKAFKDFSMFQD